VYVLFVALLWFRVASVACGVFVSDTSMFLCMCAPCLWCGPVVPPQPLPSMKLHIQLHPAQCADDVPDLPEDTLDVVNTKGEYPNILTASTGQQQPPPQQQHQPGAQAPAQPPQAQQPAAAPSQYPLPGRMPEDATGEATTTGPRRAQSSMSQRSQGSRFLSSAQSLRRAETDTKIGGDEDDGGTLGMPPVIAEEAPEFDFTVVVRPRSPVVCGVLFRALALQLTTFASGVGLFWLPPPPVCAVCGVWCVVCGVWCVVCGVWCVVRALGCPCHMVRPDQ